MREEADILKNLHHPYLPQMYDYIVDGNDVYTVMDYIEGQDLSSVPQGANVLPEQLMIAWMQQMAEVLEYLHTQDSQIIHGDIKPRNIMCRPDQTLCLIDFNVSITEESEHKIKGFSEQYASPEQIQLADTLRVFGSADWALDVRTDIYSLGATFYQLATGIVPNGRRQARRLQDIEGLGYSQAFCAIIDKCMSWDREARYPSAAKLKAALVHIKKSDARYKKYIWMRAASLILCGCLAAAGAFCIARGVKERAYENYREDYRYFIELFERADYGKAAAAGRNILNHASYGSILQSQQKDQANLFHALGDIAYENEAYGEAAGYYGQALECIRRTNFEASLYYRDYAISLAKNNQLAQAEQVLQDAAEKGVGRDALQLVKASLELQKGNYQACLETVEGLLQSCTDREIDAAACQEAANAAMGMGDVQQAADWFEKSNTYQESARSLRQLSETYVRLAQNSQKSENQMRTYGAKAVDCFERLKTIAVLTYNDYINYGIAQSLQGKNTEYIRVLQECRNIYGTSFHISMHLAFAYYGARNASSARQYCL